MVYAAHFIATILACYLTARILTHPGWPGQAWAWQSPRAAIVCWQAVGLAIGLSAIGLPLSLGLASYDVPTGTALRRFVTDLFGGALPATVGPGQLVLIALGATIAALLLGATTRSVLSTVRAQRRHRDLLALVARDDPAAPGALVLDHPSAAAYCLPGVRPQVVVSAGTLRLLDGAELAAVLSHERAHADERHDLVLLPFTALCRALPWARWVHTAYERVALLVEMRADDRARRLHADGPLAAALLRFATAPARVTPAGALGIATPPRCRAAASDGALGIADTHLDARVQRLLAPGRPPRLRVAAALGMAALLVSLPISLFLG
ncbi:Zn-dependent protease with chaperone function [Micromonospora pattaloongensis]|uniref:Zn-dependent protease with chaperone function n=1 Tax=Micromonospora pattaloongensis TaxID=405436 RepID=A0A1H3GFS5_9ACTN|nr:M56 family metallopeptidase [Micromonospora pattaloongensis]SDY01907.1 Zn-dependent protease with chaperone function [Micromonospora pattaloongensis]